MGDGTDGLRVAEARDKPPIDDREDAALRFHRGVGRLIQHAPHVLVALGTAVTVVDPALSSLPGQAPIHEARCFADGKVAAVAPTSAMICCAESTPSPGTSASRCTAS